MTQPDLTPADYVDDNYIGDDAALSKTTGSVAGYQLAPYSLEARVLWYNVVKRGDIDYICSLLLIFILKEIHAAYTKLLATMSSEEAMEFATLQVFRACDDKDTFRARALLFMGKELKTFSALQEVHKKAGEILELADKSDFDEPPQTGKESEGVDMGKIPARLRAGSESSHLAEKPDVVSGT